MTAQTHKKAVINKEKSIRHEGTSSGLFDGAFDGVFCCERERVRNGKRRLLEDRLTLIVLFGAISA